MAIMLCLPCCSLWTRIFILFQLLTANLLFAVSPVQKGWTPMIHHDSIYVHIMIQWYTSIQSDGLFRRLCFFSSWLLHLLAVLGQPMSSKCSCPSKVVSTAHWCRSRFRPPPKSLEETEFDPSESPVLLVAHGDWRISMGTVHWEVGCLQKTRTIVSRSQVRCCSRLARTVFYHFYDSVAHGHFAYACVPTGLCGFCVPYCRSLPAGSLSFWCWTSPSEAMRQLDGIECNKM